MKCKITGDKLSPFMSFGKMPSANGFLDKKDFDSEFFYEMEVGFSEKVSLLQLNEFQKAEKIFKDDIFNQKEQWGEGHYLDLFYLTLLN